MWAHIQKYQNLLHIVEVSHLIAKWKKNAECSPYESFLQTTESNWIWKFQLIQSSFVRKSHSQRPRTLNLLIAIIISIRKASIMSNTTSNLHFFCLCFCFFSFHDISYLNLIHSSSFSWAKVMCSRISDSNKIPTYIQIEFNSDTFRQNKKWKKNAHNTHRTYHVKRTKNVMSQIGALSSFI